MKLIESKNQNLKDYIFKITQEYRIYFIILFIISVIASTLEILVHYKIKEIIDVIASNEYASLSLLLIIFVFYKFMHHGMFFIVRLLDIKYKPGLATKLSVDLYKKTTKHSLHWFDSHMSGEISDKVNSFQDSFIHLITNIFRSFVILWAIIIGLIFLAKISYKSALVQLSFIVIYTPILYFLLKRQLTLQENFTKARQSATGVINDSIANIFSIKIVGSLLSEFKLKLMPALLERQKWDKKTRRFDAFWVDNIDTLLIVTMSAIQIYLLAYLYKNGEITAGGFAFVAMIMLKVHSDIDGLLEKILFGINPQIAQIRASYKFVNETYDIVDLDQSKDLKNVKGKVEFKNVNFGYESNKKILNDLNLTINAGEKVGIVGQSGAGKTTLIKSILRYFNIDSGKILIDGKDISKVTQESLWQNLAIIPQDITMFHRSILENLKLAKYDALDNEIFDACKKAKIHDDILNMQNGYNSIVGERGVKVSGGQRQRIAIARAVLKNAPILILDEATSSLDSATEKQIQKSLEILINDSSKTVIAVAHRLSTLKNMDRIIVLDKGKIVEQGTHHELLKDEKSLYKKLWKLQEI